MRITEAMLPRPCHRGPATQRPRPDSISCQFADCPCRSRRVACGRVFRVLSLATPAPALWPLLVAGRPGRGRRAAGGERQGRFPARRPADLWPSIAFRVMAAGSKRAIFASIAATTALKGGENGAAIVPGKAGRKPAARAHREQRSRPADAPQGRSACRPTPWRSFEQWIDQGAPWPDRTADTAEPAGDHWALQPLVRPAVPPGDRRGPGESDRSFRPGDARRATAWLATEPADRRTLAAAAVDRPDRLAPHARGAGGLFGRHVGRCL